RHVLAEQDRGRVSVRSGQSLRDACAAWLDLKRAQDKRATSLDNWTTALETHVYPRLGSVKVSDLRGSTRRGSATARTTPPAPRVGSPSR
ncbi:MAG: hypothetical protein M3P83_09870, partial [Actinomycetota bacterium]|nr:hypothetical protein [Actinomycetota bacterium]